VADPFENEGACHLVLVNHLGEHSLWPEVIDVPPGWQEVFRSSRRQECLDYVTANWTDMMSAGRSPHVNAS
jgi:MbtH protein